MTDRDFVRHFILSLILVQKESAFDLGIDEKLEIPSNYLDIVEELLKSDKYHSLDINFNRNNVSLALKEFVIEEATNVKGETITIEEKTISDILYDKTISNDKKVKLMMLSEDVLIKSCEKNKQKALKYID